MKLITYLLVILFCGTAFAGNVVRNGKSITEPYRTVTPQGTNHLFVKTSATGVGDCSNWDNACTFVTAVSSTSNTEQDVIWLGPGSHDTDNGTDANGTTISNNYVSIIGDGYNEDALISELHNGDAGAVYVLQVTGDFVEFRNILFTQEGQADVDVTYIYCNGASRMNIRHSLFQAGTGAASDVGIEVTGGSSCFRAYDTQFLGLQGVGFLTDDVQNLFARELTFCQNGKAIYISDANDDNMHFHDTSINDSTTGIEIDAGVSDINFIRLQMHGNTNNIDDDGGFKNVNYDKVTTDNLPPALYPDDATGIVVSTGAVANWTLGSLTQVVPASTITEPFFVTGINVRAASASNTFKVVLYYDSAAGTTYTIGTYEFTQGATFFGITTNVSTINDLSTEAIPANSYIGAKVASSTSGGGADSVTITISYEIL